MTNIVKQDIIEKKIFLVKGLNVMLDKNLAGLYGVPTKRLIEQVKRNIKRFPEDFMFQLTRNEFKILRSHFATSSWGGRRYLPYVFTEQGVAMLSSVLNSERAILVNIGIMRVFVNIRKLVSANKGILNKLNQLEYKVHLHDKKIKTIFEIIHLKKAPVLKSEDEVFKFWAKHDSTDYVDWSKGGRALFPNIRPTSKPISIRFPVSVLNRLKSLANMIRIFHINRLSRFS